MASPPPDVSLLRHLVQLAGGHLSRLLHHPSEQGVGLLEETVRSVKLLHLSSVHHLVCVCVCVSECERERGGVRVEVCTHTHTHTHTHTQGSIVV